jgi:hypothetical protein
MDASTLEKFAVVHLQSNLFITTLDYITPRCYDTYPIDHVSSVNLPSYYDCDTCNRTFFRHDLSYNRLN